MVRSEYFCSIFDIPPRSPDLNPIENVFHNVRRELAIQVKEIRLEKESYENYAARVVQTIKNVPIDLINRTIDSLPKRMNMVVKSKGDRIMY